MGAENLEGILDYHRSKLRRVRAAIVELRNIDSTQYNNWHRGQLFAELHKREERCIKIVGHLEVVLDSDGAGEKKQLGASRD